MLILQDEERADIPEESVKDTNCVVGFRLVFLGDRGQAIRKMEIRQINFQDVIRHLQHGDSVLITPKLENSETCLRSQDMEPWYFSHV
jgi:hypothetical protein